MIWHLITFVNACLDEYKFIIHVYKYNAISEYDYLSTITMSSLIQYVQHFFFSLPTLIYLYKTMRGIQMNLK